MVKKFEALIQFALRLPDLDRKQVCILIAIAIAAAMTTFYTRFLSVSLADLRGIWRLSADEGSILSTTATASQHFLAPALPWLSAKFGFRIFLLPTSLCYALISLFIPFCVSYPVLLFMHGILGVLLGCFVAVTILLTLKLLPPAWWIISLSFFVFRVSLGTNAGVSLSGYYIEFAGWQWIYWQGTAVMLIYYFLLDYALPPDKTENIDLKGVDFQGMILFSISTMLLFIGFDQAERLGWLNSGFIQFCLFGGLAILLLFIWHELRDKKPWASPILLAHRNIILVLFIILMYIFMVAANGLLIMRFLNSMHNLKVLHSGDILLIICLGQLISTPLAILAIKVIDPRLVCALGFTAFAVAFLAAAQLTQDWIGHNFFSIAILFSIGHPFVFLGLLSICIASFEMKTAPSMLSYVQFIRIFAPTFCGVIYTYILRVFNDRHLAYLYSRIQENSPGIKMWLEENSGLENLGGIAQKKALLLSTSDAFYVSFYLALAAIYVLVCMHRPKHTPLNPGLV